MDSGSNMMYELVILSEKLSEKIEIEKIIVIDGYIINKETGEVVGQVFAY
jgi:hypothetical protein